MAIGRAFDWIQFSILICLLLMAMKRSLMLHRQGVHVLIADRQRTLAQVIADLLMGVCLLVWGGGVIAQTLLQFIPVAGTIPLLLPQDGIALKLLGASVEVLGLCLYGIALRELGVSWRLGIDRKAPGPLVTSGIYSRSRHPIYVAFDCLFTGTFLVLGQGVFLLLAILMVPLLHTVMRREECYLTKLYGAPYVEYCSRVGRYWTWK